MYANRRDGDARETRDTTEGGTSPRASDAARGGVLRTAARDPARPLDMNVVVAALPEHVGSAMATLTLGRQLEARWAPPGSAGCPSSWLARPTRRSRSSPSPPFCSRSGWSSHRDAVTSRRPGEERPVPGEQAHEVGRTPRLEASRK